MPIVRIVGGKDHFSPRRGRDMRIPRGSKRYRIRCEGLSKEESLLLTEALERHFQILPEIRRNPYLPSPWDGVYSTALVLAPILLPTLIGILNDFRKDRIAKGKEPMTVMIYGPDGKPVKWPKRPRAREKSRK